MRPQYGTSSQMHYGTNVSSRTSSLTLITARTQYLRGHSGQLVLKHATASNAVSNAAAGQQGGTACGAPSCTAT